MKCTPKVEHFWGVPKQKEPMQREFSVVRDGVSAKWVANQNKNLILFAFFGGKFSKKDNEPSLFQNIDV